MPRNSGLTLASVMVASMLAGAVGVAVLQITRSQGEALAVLQLREEQAEILTHYRMAMISGWDRTRQNFSSPLPPSPFDMAVYDRDGALVIPILAGGTGLQLKEDIYGSHTANGWWQVTATGNSFTSTAVQLVDTPGTAGGTGIFSGESLIAGHVKVEFLPSNHPLVRFGIKEREKIAFFHHNVELPNPISETSCDGGAVVHKSRAGIYPGSAEGAIIRYDAKSDDIKCSQAPIWNLPISSAGQGALVGYRGGSALYSGAGAITIPDVDCGVGRFVQKVSTTGSVTCGDVLPVTRINCKTIIDINHPGVLKGAVIAVYGDGSAECMGTAGLAANTGPQGGCPPSSCWTKLCSTATSCNGSNSVPICP